MQTKTQFALLALLAGFAATPAMADHNSVWGAGWANMPNDIHNTRLEDNLDSAAWQEFVSKGAGSQTVNRYTTDSTTLPSQRSMTGTASQTTTSGMKRR